ncbi:hypothetical protein BD769DRAFT_254110 [Suillus cothurnatus]|nr:hypothetical protein BD769DRAFT_254110 [Suillus cothurnatus]
MTIVSNDPSWWPVINSNIFFTCWLVAAGVVVVYDWVLTLGQEIELIWRQRWSLMTVLYLVIRYIGIPYSVISAYSNMPPVSVTDAVSNIMNYVINLTNVVVAAMLGVIMISRLYAMYQRSWMMLLFLVIICLAVNIACGAIAVIALEHVDAQLLTSMVWMLNTTWEVLVLCLSVCVAVKHFRDLRRLGPSTGSITGDCFRVLIQSHVLYFASFAGVSCIQLGLLSPGVLKSQSMGAQIINGAFQVFLSVQMFVLGPRLILSVRECHAKLVARFDAETSMNSFFFEERVHVSTSSTV